MRDGDGVRRNGAGLKSRPIPAPPPLRGGENPRGEKRGWAKLSSLVDVMLPLHSLTFG